MQGGAAGPVSPFRPPAFMSAFTDYAGLRGQTVGMTGHRGILGGVLHERLSRAGIDVQAYPGNINDAQALADWFGGKHFGCFFHFAAVVPVTVVEADPLTAYRTNVIGAFEVCQAVLRTQHDCWLFHASSSHVYAPTAEPTALAEDAPTHPQTYYGVTKLAAEQVITPLLRKLQAPYCVGRIFSFSHARQKEPYLVPSLRRRIEQLENGATLEVSNPASVRDIQDAESIVDCVLHLARRRATGIVNIGTGVGLSVKEIALAVARSLNKNIQVTGVDAPGSTGALIADTTRLQTLLRA